MRKKNAKTTFIWILLFHLILLSVQTEGNLIRQVRQFLGSDAGPADPPMARSMEISPNPKMFTDQESQTRTSSRPTFWESIRNFFMAPFTSMIPKRRVDDSQTADQTVTDIPNYSYKLGQAFGQTPVESVVVLPDPGALIANLSETDEGKLINGISALVQSEGFNSSQYVNAVADVVDGVAGLVGTLLNVTNQTGHDLGAYLQTVKERRMDVAEPFGILVDINNNRTTLNVLDQLKKAIPATVVILKQLAQDVMGGFPDSIKSLNLVNVFLDTIVGFLNVVRDAIYRASDPNSDKVVYWLTVVQQSKDLLKNLTDVVQDNFGGQLSESLLIIFGSAENVLQTLSKDGNNTPQVTYEVLKGARDLAQLWLANSTQTGNLTRQLDDAIAKLEAGGGINVTDITTSPPNS